MIHPSSEESGFCAQCGTANARTAAFCAKCGSPLPWAAPKVEPVAPQVVAPTPVAAPVPPAPIMPPATPIATQAAPVATPAQAAASATAPNVPVLDGLKRLGKILFPRELLTAYKGASPQELLRLYGARVVGLVLLVVLVKSFADSIFDLLVFGTIVCLVVGLKKPDSFRWIFGDKTSKATVGWTLAGLLLILGMIGSSMEPKKENAGLPITRTARKPAEEKAPPAQVPVLPAKRVVLPPVVLPPAPRKRTAQQTIEDAMKDQFGDRLRQVKVSHLVRDIYNVKVEFNNSVRLSAKATKGYMEGDMQDAYEASLEALGTGTDKYGQPFQAPAYHTLLSREVASKINWKDHRAARWDDLWTVIFLHRQYRPENLGRNWKKEEEEAKKSFEPEEIERVMRERRSRGQ